MFGLSKLIYLVKKSELAFNVISVPVDFLMIFLSASLAYFLRYRVETLPVLFDLSYFQYLQLILVAIPFLLLLFALNGLYAQKSTHGIWREALAECDDRLAPVSILGEVFFAPFVPDGPFEQAALHEAIRLRLAPVQLIQKIQTAQLPSAQRAVSNAYNLTDFHIGEAASGQQENLGAIFGREFRHAIPTNTNGGQAIARPPR